MKNLKGAILGSVLLGFGLILNSPILSTLCVIGVLFGIAYVLDKPAEQR